MNLVAEYQAAKRAEEHSRLRRVVALRGLLASGLSQRQIASALGVSQPAVSQQLKHAPDLQDVSPTDLLLAATPTLREIAAHHGFSDLAVFGSIARGDARPDSDIDLIVQPPPEASTVDLLRFKHLIEQILDREIDLVTYGGLTAGLDDDVRREAVVL